jgi:hypothetical protein
MRGPNYEIAQIVRVKATGQQVRVIHRSHVQPGDKWRYWYREGDELQHSFEEELEPTLTQGGETYEPTTRG